jgi:hypothetical protein
MSYDNYERRVNFYLHAVDSAQAVLSHPDIDAPDHPYLPWLSGMLEGAPMVVPDRLNGVLYTADHIDTKFPYIALMPLLPVDCRPNADEAYFTTQALTTQVDKTISLGRRNLSDYAASATLDPGVRLPLVALSPVLASRSKLQVGITLAHELDHIYRMQQGDKLFWYGSETTSTHTMLEVAAYRLEEKLYIAHEPEAYDAEKTKIQKRCGKRDFSQKYRPRDNDPHARSMRATAFINFMFDALGAEVGTRPGRKLMKAMKDQDLLAA